MLSLAIFSRALPEIRRYLQGIPAGPEEGARAQAACAALPAGPVARGAQQGGLGAGSRGDLEGALVPSPVSSRPGGARVAASSVPDGPGATGPTPPRKRPSASSPRAQRAGRPLTYSGGLRRGAG